MDAHNLIYDIPGLADTKEPLFSLVKEWKLETRESLTTSDEKGDSFAKAPDPSSVEKSDSNSPSDDDLNDHSLAC
jgi:hypothetical protein